MRKMSRDEFGERFLWGGGEVLHEEHVDETRWSYIKRYAVKVDDNIYLANIEFPATEMQEVSQDEVSLIPAKAETKTVTVYVPAEEA